MVRQLNLSVFFFQVFNQLLRYQKQSGLVSKINVLGQGSEAMGVWLLPTLDWLVSDQLRQFLSQTPGSCESFFSLCFAQKVAREMYFYVVSPGMSVLAPGGC